MADPLFKSAPTPFRHTGQPMKIRVGYDMTFDFAAEEHAISELPHETLIFLLGSRYCETDRMMQKAWELFGKTPRGWRRVQAVCDFVHHHLEFGYKHAGAMRGAAEAYDVRRGVCRDFAHLAVTLCRCMNIPARYCTGYLGDIG